MTRQRLQKWQAAKGLVPISQTSPQSVKQPLFASVSELDRRGELNMYYAGAIRFRRMADLPDAISRLRRYRATYGNAHTNTLKLFLDGTNESGNSALILPVCSHASGDTFLVLQ